MIVGVTRNMTATPESRTKRKFISLKSTEEVSLSYLDREPVPQPEDR